MKGHFRRAVISTLVLLLGVSCTSSYQKRGTETPLPPRPLDEVVGTTREDREKQINLEARSIEHYDGMSVGIIEIDDDGNVNPAQARAVKELLREKSRTDALIVVFVHGWHHGARVCDRDLACFRRVLQQLARVNSHRNVVGVFVGWRGESVSVRGLNLLTIWDRKRVAEHIGRTGFRETLLDIREIYQEARQRPESNDTTLVTLGHSLGGALLYQAVKGQLTGNVSDIERPGQLGSYRIVRASEDREIASAERRKALRAGFGDLVVLINPALEAREYGAFNADLPDHFACDSNADELIAGLRPYDANCAYSSEQLPILLTVASRADTAVGWIFPVAQILGALPQLRPYQLMREGFTGMGRYQDHITHTLTHPERERPAEERSRIAHDCDCSKDWLAQTEKQRDEGPRLDLAADSRQQFGELVFDIVDSRQESWDPHTPYLVISTSKGVIEEHSDIFNPVFVGFLTKYIRAIELARDRQPTMQRR